MKENRYVIPDNIQVLFETTSNDRFWFGYYNYCPIDDTGNKLLAHRWGSNEEEEREFNQNDIIDVGWFDLQTKQWHYVATTRACNWQQGAMSQWIFIDGEQRIIFNDADNGVYISRIYNADGTLYKNLPIAIYGINEKEQFSITINFERAYWCRAYHYQFIRDEQYNRELTDKDGIYKLDIKTGQFKKLIDINSILQYDFNPDFLEGKHWVEHIMLNPQGNLFAFYHRFDNGTGYKTRCLVADVEGHIICSLKDWTLHSWSHLGWIDNENFVIYGITRKPLGNLYSAVTLNSGKLGKFLRKIYRNLFSKHVSPQMHNKLATGNGYEIYNISGERLGIIDVDLLINDGHPSFTKDKHYMLTDTYAFDGEYRYLLLFDMEEKNLKVLGKFYSPINATSYRCDLHPRFGNSENIIVIDSAHSGRHGMIVLKMCDE